MKKSFAVALLLWASCALLHAEFLPRPEIRWNRAETVQSGVQLLRLQFTSPRLLRVNLMRVRLSGRKVRFAATDRDPDWGKPMPDFKDGEIPIRSKRITTAQFMLDLRREGANVIVAANAAPWWPWVKPYTHKYAHPAGLNIARGRILCDTRPHNAVFYVDKKGRLVITGSVDGKLYPDIEMAVSGFGLLLRDGKVLPPGGYEKSLMPRMAYGLSRDRKYIYFITVDGRQEEWSLGATGPETAELLALAGAWDAIDMDGGGSASLCYFDRKTQKPVMVNRHTQGGYMRPVGSSIGIILE